MRRILETLAVSLVGFVLIAGGLVALTVSTAITATTMRLWVEAVGGVLAAAAAIIVALLGFRAQRHSAQEAAQAERDGAAEAAEAALKEQRERFENQRAMEREREAANEAMAKRMQARMDRRRAYSELMAFAVERLGNSGADYRHSYRGFGEALVVASEEVLQAANAFESTPSRANYERLMQIIRDEVAAEAPEVDEQ
jgi:hypothetical protein